MKYLVSKRKQGGKKKYEQFFATEEGMQVVWIIVGCLIYAVGLNVFIIPMNLYSGEQSVLHSC